MCTNVAARVLGSLMRKSQDAAHSVPFARYAMNGICGCRTAHDHDDIRTAFQ